MTSATPAHAPRHSAPRPQNASGTCVTHRLRTAKLAALYVSIVALGVVAAVASYSAFRPSALTHPGFEQSSVSGEPQVDERFGYSTLQVTDGYEVRLCGVPANDGQVVELNLTNPATNSVWLRAEVIDEEGDVIGSTGVLRQGEHLPSVTLSRALGDGDTPVTVRVMAYEPDTWRSRGNVNLRLTLSRGRS